MQLLYYKIILGFMDFILKPVYLELVRLYTPNIFGFTKKGFGRKGDGRYILPLELLHKLDNIVVLSFGVADDISFEQDLLKDVPSAKVFCFDPSIDDLPEKDERIKFSKIGLAGNDIPSKNLFSFATILDKMDLKKPCNLLIKMDIEGWEWGFLESVDLQKMNVSFFTAELHVKMYNFYSVFLLPFSIYNKYRILKRISNDYYIFHTHANNYRYTKFKNFIMPDLVELTFINKAVFYEQIVNDVKELNVTNVAYQEDFQYPFIHKK